MSSRPVVHHGARRISQTELPTEAHNRDGQPHVLSASCAAKAVEGILRGDVKKLAPKMFKDSAAKVGSW